MYTFFSRTVRVERAYLMRRVDLPFDAKRHFASSKYVVRGAVVLLSSITISYNVQCIILRKWMKMDTAVNTINNVIVN